MISKAVEVLRRGGLVAFPTETVYGLGANAEDELAVRRIFAIKGRPHTHPLIVHLPDHGFLDLWARDIPQLARVATAAFWPGPLTVVLRRSRRSIDLVTGGQDTVALRVPAHPLAAELLRAFRGGIAAPSANRFGRVSPTTAKHVENDLQSDVDLIIDGGPCPIGVESTILDLTGLPRILRPGGVTAEELETVLGVKVPVQQTSAVRVPGSLPLHYAPRAGVVIVDAEEIEERSNQLRRNGHKVAVIAQTGMSAGPGIPVFPMADLNEFARQLYGTFRRIDQEGYDMIVIQRPPNIGVGVAINDRLSRASGSTG